MVEFPQHSGISAEWWNFRIIAEFPQNSASFNLACDDDECERFLSHWCFMAAKHHEHAYETFRIAWIYSIQLQEAPVYPVAQDQQLICLKQVQTCRLPWHSKLQTSCQLCKLVFLQLRLSESLDECKIHFPLNQLKSLLFSTANIMAGLNSTDWID